MSTRAHVAEWDENSNAHCPACEAEQAGEQELPPIWFEPGDIADLTFETGETIRALWTRPKGTHAGWVLTDGTRLRARPKTLAHIEIVYPPEHRATEHVVRPDPEQHTTEDEHHD